MQAYVDVYLLASSLKHFHTWCESQDSIVCTSSFKNVVPTLGHLPQMQSASVLDFYYLSPQAGSITATAIAAIFGVVVCSYASPCWYILCKK